MQLLREALRAVARRQGLLGVTGSDKMFTIAHVISKTQKPRLDMMGASKYLIVVMALTGSAICGLVGGEKAAGDWVQTLPIQCGDLCVLLRDNSQSPKILSGIDSLFHLKAARDFDAFDPDNPGASAGLNFEHVICGHPNPANSFTPRRGRFDLYRLSDGRSALLLRKSEDDPWRLSSVLKYTVREPHFVDFEFECRSHDASLFGPRGYAVLFFANYMNDVEEVPLRFRGVAAPGEPEKWILAEAQPGHPDYSHGGTYRSLTAADLKYDEDHNFKLNLWSYDFPRFTQPFYYGRAAHGMVFMLMFDKMHSREDEIRFSLFKFKLPRRPRPAWDFQYVLHKVEAGKAYGFQGRLVWKKFVSPDDCLAEYRRWKEAQDAQAGKEPPQPK